jgi:predicted transcriptional regulator of viral defense system
LADPHRTVVDMLDNPRLGGGARHMSDCLTAYLRSEHASREKVIAYAERIGNGAVFKRLGFLAERALPADDLLTAACRERLTKGYASLDAALPGDRIITRWRLRVPRSLAHEARGR